MKTNEKIEALNAAAAKAENTMNAKTWQAHKMNAANVLKDVAAAAAIINRTEAAADAVTYLYGQFIAIFNAKVKKGDKFEASFSAIKGTAQGHPVILANAVGRRGFDFAAAVRGCMAYLGNLDKAARCLAWERTTAERKAKAEAEGAKKSKNAAKRAARAAAKAEAIRQAVGEDNAGKLLAAYDKAKAKANADKAAN
jgi:hypothetical protein